jgi:Hydrogenase/urease nickel incorporation, metallochaperone, hypA
MHEMGVASSILEAAWKEARLYPGHRPAKVGVLIGAYAGVDTESLRFCFEVLAKDHQPPIELDITWRADSDALDLAFLEMEEVHDEPSHDREEDLKRERSNRGAAA